MSMPQAALFLDRLISLKGLRPNTWYLIAATTSTALGHGHIWVPTVYRHARSEISASILTQSQITNDPTNQPSRSVFTTSAATLTPSPSLKIVQRLKEAIFKSAILIGVPRAIEASFSLRAATENTPDFDTSFTREGIDATAEGNRQRGLEGLERVYRKQYGPISSKMGEGMKEIKWMSENITYGLFLYPVSESDPRAPLSFPETEIVILSCLLAHRAKREVLWHLRGALRSGLTIDEVEAVQTAVEMMASELGEDVKTGMPRVSDVTEDDDLTGL